MNTDKTSIYLSPKDILDKIGALIPREPVIVRGVVKRFNGYYKITENESGVDIDFGEIEPLDYIDMQVEIKGLLSCYIHSIGGIYPKVNVKEIKIIDDGNPNNNLKEQIRELILLKKRRVLINELPEINIPMKVAVIHGKNAQTPVDFKRGFDSSAGKYKDYVSFNFIETSLGDDSLASVIKSIEKDYSVFFIVRGGGEQQSIAKVGGYNSAKALIESGKPFYLALGHSLDMNLSILEYVSDQNFETPTMAGVSFGKAVAKAKEREEIEDKFNTIRIRNAEILKENEVIKEKMEQFKKFTFGLAGLSLLLLLLLIFK